MKPWMLWILMGFLCSLVAIIVPEQNTFLSVFAFLYYLIAAASMFVEYKREESIRNLEDIRFRITLDKLEGIRGSLINNTFNSHDIKEILKEIKEQGGIKNEKAKRGRGRPRKYN